MISYQEFSGRVESVLARIASACTRAGRSSTEVKLLAVTKNHPVEAPEYVARYGLDCVGENRVQEAISKRELCRAKLRWELIGHLQSNKAKIAARHFDCIQSVDSEKLLRQLDDAAKNLGKRLHVLLQINAGNDPAKFGADSKDALSLLETALDCPALQVDGLMTIAPLNQEGDLARPTFDNLRMIRDRLVEKTGHPLPELSMGMTGDLEAAIMAGSTCVRIGTALFGARE